MRPAMTSSTWIENAVGADLPLPTPGRRQRPVTRLHDRREPLLAEGVDSKQPAPDVAGTPHPQFERWHLEDGVVAQQADERVDVVALEGIDVGGEQLAIVRRGLARRRVRVDWCERGARARRSVLFTASTLVPRSTATSVARQRSTSRKMSTARCRGARCCSAAMKASRTDSRDTTSASGVTVRRQHQAVRRRLDPGRFRSGIATAEFAARGGHHLDRQRAPCTTLEHVDADVGGDPVQPRAQPDAILERRQ